MTHDIVVAPAATADILSILIWSQDTFGAAVRTGYEELLIAAIDDIAADPSRPGVREYPELGDGICSWHIALSRHHVGTDAHPITKPRHLLFFRESGNEVQILRVLHEAMDLTRHQIG